MKTSRGGLRYLKKECKIVHAGIPPLPQSRGKYPIKIVEKYMNLLPIKGKKSVVCTCKH